MVTYFFLTGFQNIDNYKTLFFIFILSIYAMTVSGNLLIVTLVSSSHLSQSPMYFFLSHLSVCDFLFSSNIVPNMMHITLEGGSTMSFSACLIQFYMFASCTATECYLLTVMSFDRFVAICVPLHYTIVVNSKLCLHLAIWSWLLGFLFVLITVLLICQLDFCGSMTIDHFYCDFISMLQLSCSDVSPVVLETFFFAIVIVLLPFLTVLGSYVSIFWTIIGIPSSTGRKKTFSTCSSHLLVVGTYYGSLLSIYLFPSGGHSENIKTLSLLYTLGTPLLNPLIYCFRNQEIQRQFSRIVFFKKNIQPFLS
ncbi:olfactory receptor 11L1-like [Bufo gargarizans]|uniref:olfactory receptor 11L1-like n=1 Tax=Bufo gargarizans TaxID=30331 RepID=UPI001CF158FE|nr:olfactory receptor 11L1-like [Bufo gargarizans]